ncbi:DUF1254 domain-containing protein [Streptomyces sp. BH097]|uniref:DUF1254 domain-containing protein n=1 Tax=unclassified Streptomyces TaxID=2593676 RepID=UPI003BB5DB6E
MEYVGYDVDAVAQHAGSCAPDMTPAGAGERAVWQYAQMCTQPLTADAPASLFRFAHERALAGPEFTAFRVPNVDTLYSNAWLDLRGGPVEVRLPDFGSRYFTVQIIDAYSNSSNISHRRVTPSGTSPSQPGRTSQ